MKEKHLKETKIKSRSIFDGEILHVKKDSVRLPNGNETSRELIRHIGAVCIVAINDKGEVAVERQYRYPIDKIITEIPAGKLDAPDEGRLEAAKRELREETGLTARSWTYMGSYIPAAAYSDEFITMYLARDLETGEQELDDDEFLEVLFVPLHKLIDDVMNDKIADGKTQVALLKAALMLTKPLK